MSTVEWKKQNTSQFPIRFTNNSGVPAALKKAAEDNGIAVSTYIRDIIISRLKEDGYLKSGDPE